LSAAFEAIAIRLQKRLHSSETAPPEKFDPADDNHGTDDHRVEQLEKRPLSVIRQQMVNAPFPYLPGISSMVVGPGCFDKWRKIGVKPRLGKHT
jgi:hypothetical protein